MRARRCIALAISRAAVTLSITASLANAQWYRPTQVTLLSRYTGFDAALDTRANTGLGARVGFALRPGWMIEAELSNTSARQYDPYNGRPAYVPFYLRATTQRRINSRLSTIVGGGYVRNTYGSRNIDDAGVNVLGGLQLTVNSRVAIRVDGMLDYMPSAWTEFTNGRKQNVNRGVQLGVTVPLAETRRVPRAVPRPPVVFERTRDRDGDGVPDWLDRCDATGLTETADLSGCAPAQRDGDADGVVDAADRCLTTAAGSRVDASGCELVVSAVPLAITQPVAIESRITFPLGSALSPEARQALDDIAQTLIDNGDLVVDVGGHSDARGTASANQALSLKRATVVRDYLVSRGVESSRLHVRGYGSSKPLLSTRLNDANNRRVEITSRPAAS
jgi:outer membrane protein OmpA-like peptidoglycan-associated protein